MNYSHYDNSQIITTLIIGIYSINLSSVFWLEGAFFNIFSI